MTQNDRMIISRLFILIKLAMDYNAYLMSWYMTQGPKSDDILEKIEKFNAEYEKIIDQVFIWTMEVEK